MSEIMVIYGISWKTCWLLIFASPKHWGSGNQSRRHHQRRKLAVFREDLGTFKSSRSDALHMGNVWRIRKECRRNVEWKWIPGLWRAFPARPSPQQSPQTMTACDCDGCRNHLMFCSALGHRQSLPWAFGTQHCWKFWWNYWTGESRLNLEHTLLPCCKDVVPHCKLHQGHNGRLDEGRLRLALSEIGCCHVATFTNSLGHLTWNLQALCLMSAFCKLGISLHRHT